MADQAGEPLAFFTLDRGTATTAAALIGRVGGRFRLLASGSMPAAVPTDALLGDLAERVASVEPELVPPSGWESLARLEAASRTPPRVVCIAGNEGRLAELERAVGAAGWEIALGALPGRPDALGLAEAVLDREVDAVAIATGSPPRGDERHAVRDLAEFVAPLVRRRTGVLVLLAGAAADHADQFANLEVVTANAPEPVPATTDTALRRTAEALAQRAGGRRMREAPVTDDAEAPATDVPDVRAGFRSGIESLASLLDRRVEGVDIGWSGGARALATPEGLRASIIRSDAGLVPPASLTGDKRFDAVLRWSPLRGDLFAMRDRVRNLLLAPWRDAAGDGARLRLAAARAALTRLDHAWSDGADRDGRLTRGAPDILVASGGAFAVAPAPAAALALVDTLRRPGGTALFLDHARLLGPIGSLPDPSDRRRLLADLLDDALIPLGSAILAADLRPGRSAGTLRVTANGIDTELELTPGSIQLVDLPPGVAGTADLETREGAWLGVRARRFALDVTGGLGGLLVDTREVPLRLPERSERRREVIDAWERPLWIGGDQ
jgi:hypothetical protein